jgi:hypothetical protein
MTFLIRLVYLANNDLSVDETKTKSSREIDLYLTTNRHVLTAQEGDGILLKHVLKEVYFNR